MKITLCGSTRFKEHFTRWNHELTLAGHLVYSLGLFGREAKDEHKGDAPLVTDREKIILDLVHLAKIEESDAVVVIDVDNYVGFSTQREIIWAQMRGKPVHYMTAGLDHLLHVY